MKRLTYLLSIIGAVVLVILVGSFLRYRSSEPGPGQGSQPGSLPDAPTQYSGPQAEPTAIQPDEPSEQPPIKSADQKFGVIAQNKVLNFFVDNQNNVVLVQPDGQVVRVTRGEPSILSSSIITKLIRAQFSHNGEKLLATFGDRSALQHSVFDIANKSWSPLPPDLNSATWSPTDDEIAYIVEKDGVASITTLDASDPKAKPKELISLHAEDLSLRWISKNQIILVYKGSVVSPGSILSLDIQKKALSPIVIDALGLSSIWSGDAGMGLVFRADISRKGGGLSLIDTAGNVLNDLSPLTLPSKCVFSVSPADVSSEESSATSSDNPTGAEFLPLKKALYCAIPKNTQELEVSPLPDIYQKRGLFTADDLFKIDLSSGDIEEVFTEHNQLLDAYNLKIFNDTLFFVNRLDQKLYAVSL